MKYDLVLQRYQREQRPIYAVMSVVLVVFSIVVYFNQETWASPILCTIVLVFLWLYRWNTGRRINTGAFAAGTSVVSQIERADLERWLEHKGATELPDTHLSG